ncbi:hypothetical protein [Bifidobacterium oedipodis]|uniref:Lipoprotein n=1 Tax=Bifidobacterium oedipodis TaxID=2675322 RepID=A0A7Y0ENN9_9BIFI|nr:hypothetical protein [Bifidobacterium sp. DSM 109957]NMM93597.1 hypothetical protein [Bifidobacterium sp. DSM 109957]
MSYRREARRKVAVILVAATFCIGAQGCSNADQGSERSGGVVSQARMAASISEYAQQWLDWAVANDVQIGQEQRTSINRVIETGEVDVSDYEAALDGYRQCMLDRGYKEIVFADLGDGLKKEAQHKAGTNAQEQKYMTDRLSCSDYHSSGISNIYEMQIGNPQLYQDHNEAIADCLRRKQVVDASYTGEEFAKEEESYDHNMQSGSGSESWTFSFPEDSPAANQCMASNGWMISKVTDLTEQLW